MSKYSEIYGVDISKDVFDVYSGLNGHYQYPNNADGFKRLINRLDSDVLVVMEATGYYHYQLASFLTDYKLNVAVVNPLSVKRFLQMKLSKVKTDRSDAVAIRAYAMSNEVSLDLYQPDNDATIECLQLLGLIETQQWFIHGVAISFLFSERFSKIQKNPFLCHPNRWESNSRPE